MRVRWPLAAREMSTRVLRRKECIDFGVSCYSAIVVFSFIADLVSGDFGVRNLVVHW